VKNSGRVWGENPEVPRTTWLAGDGIGHNKRLLTIGGHLRYSSRSSRNGIPFAATMLLDNARTPFAISPWLPLRWLDHHVDFASRIDGQKAEAQETTQLLHSRIAFSAMTPLRGPDGEPNFVANGRAINGLKHQFEREALLHLADHYELG
jgi:hypothetical protein